MTLKDIAVSIGNFNFVKEKANT